LLEDLISLLVDVDICGLLATVGGAAATGAERPDDEGFATSAGGRIGGGSAAEETRFGPGAELGAACAGGGRPFCCGCGAAGSESGRKTKLGFSATGSPI